MQYFINTIGFTDGFFSLFGFGNRSLEKKVEDVMRESASEKIQKDLKRINATYRAEYQHMRSNLLLNA